MILKKLTKYYAFEEMLNIEIPHEYKLLSLFLINACSHNKNFVELVKQELQNKLNFKIWIK